MPQIPLLLLYATQHYQWFEINTVCGEGSELNNESRRDAFLLASLGVAAQTCKLILEVCSLWCGAKKLEQYSGYAAVYYTSYTNFIVNFTENSAKEIN
jgi:hypothetical protein